MNGPNKLKCYITLGCKGLPGTNNLSSWAYYKITKKIKCCEYATRLVFLQKGWVYISSLIMLIDTTQALLNKRLLLDSNVYDVYVRQFCSIFFVLLANWASLTNKYTTIILWIVSKTFCWIIKGNVYQIFYCKILSKCYYYKIVFRLWCIHKGTYIVMVSTQGGIPQSFLSLTYDHQAP